MISGSRWSLTTGYLVRAWVGWGKHSSSVSPSSFSSDLPSKKISLQKIFAFVFLNLYFAKQRSPRKPDESMGDAPGRTKKIL